MAKVQGKFTSTGANTVIDVPIAVDSFRVINYTQMGSTDDKAVEFQWQNGMADGEGVYYYKDGVSDNLNGNVNSLAGNPGFALINSADQSVSSARSVASVSNATNFVVTATTAADTNILSNGDVVRLSNVETAVNTRGFDFEISSLNKGAGTFENAYALATAPGGAGGGASAAFRKVDFDPIFYPRWRYIVNISQAAQAVVTTSVSHGYQVGQTVRMTIPAAFGMVEMSGLSATVVAVTAGTFTLDLNSSTFSAFAWPATLGKMAVVSPDKMDTAQALSSNVNNYSDARENQAQRGMLLYGGDNSPAGSNGDVIYWEAESAELISNS